MPNLVALAVLLFTTLPASAADALTAGFASVDITPALGDKPVYMAGFGPNRLAARVHDPLVARAVVLGDGKQVIALVSVDLVGLFLPSVENVRAKLSDFSYVLVSSTHNHEGPDTLGLWGRSPFTSGVDANYMKRVEAACVEAVTNARKQMRTVTAAIGSVRAPELVTDNRLPVVKHDELVALQFTDPAAGKPAGVIVQWNCHPETLGSRNTDLSADFVGYTVKHVEDHFLCPAVYLTGTVGGLMTSLGVVVNDDNGVALKDGTHEKTARFGTKVGEAAVRALATPTPLTLTPFTVRTKAVLVPIDNDLYKLGWQFGVLARPLYAYAGDPATPTFTPTRDITKPAALKTEVGYLKLGDLDIAAIPGEIYPELVLGRVPDPAEPGADFPDAPIEPAIYPCLTAKHKMLVGLANDELGYFVPKRQWDVKPPFCYGRKQAQYGEVNSVSPDAAGIICTTFRALVKPAAVAPK